MRKKNFLIRLKKIWTKYLWFIVIFSLQYLNIFFFYFRNIFIHSYIKVKKIVKCTANHILLIVHFEIKLSLLLRISLVYIHAFMHIYFYITVNPMRVRNSGIYSNAMWILVSMYAYKYVYKIKNMNSTLLLFAFIHQNFRTLFNLI